MRFFPPLRHFPLRLGKASLLNQERSYSAPFYPRNSPSFISFGTDKYRELVDPNFHTVSREKILSPIVGTTDRYYSPPLDYLFVVNTILWVDKIDLH